MQTAFCLEQTAFCLVQTAVSCAFNQLLGLFFAAITAHFKIALFILESRINKAILKCVVIVVRINLKF